MIILGVVALMYIAFNQTRSTNVIYTPIATEESIESLRGRCAELAIADQQALEATEAVEVVPGPTPTPSGTVPMEPLTVEENSQEASPVQ